MFSQFFDGFARPIAVLHFSNLLALINGQLQILGYNLSRFHSPFEWAGIDSIYLYLCPDQSFSHRFGLAPPVLI
jgi:hypothetical protein